MDTTLKCILLDDELPGLAYLKLICGQLPELEIVKAFNDPVAFMAAMPELEFDLCITDIEMPGIDGLALARALHGKMIIFTTAYKNYAAEAFEVNAVDYVPKPVKKERLEQAAHKALDLFNKRLPVRNFIRVNTDKGKALLYFSKILYIRTAGYDSRDKEAMIADGSKMLLKNINFEKLAQQLPAADFCRINKKEMVAIKAVKFFSHNEIVLKNADIGGRNIALTLSETYRSSFMGRI